MRKFFKLFLFLLLSVCTSICVTVFFIRKYESTISPSPISENATVDPTYPHRNLYHNTSLPDFTNAAERSIDAVVHVQTAFRNQQYYTNPWFEFFFGRSPQREMPLQYASGSGVILSTDGYIVTNNHVIKNAQIIHIVLNDKREFDATLVGADPNTDIALLKIDASDLPFLPFGNSNELQIGEWVLAVGNPFNLTSTVTAGIVSAKSRNLNALSTNMKIESFIQTDAAVNPGNSGGALVNTKGELIGINTAIASQTGSYSGYSFAIPATIVQKVVEDIKLFGSVQRSYLGVMIQEITPELQKRYHLVTLQGVYVASTIPNGVAHRYGIRQGDVITEIDNLPIKTITELQERIATHRPGDTIHVTIKRNEQTFKLTLKL